MRARSDFSDDHLSLKLTPNIEFPVTYLLRELTPIVLRCKIKCVQKTRKAAFPCIPYYYYDVIVLVYDSRNESSGHIGSLSTTTMTTVHCLFIADKKLLITYVQIRAVYAWDPF